MATITLKNHSVDIQSELEIMNDNMGGEPTDVKFLAAKIVAYALANPELFVVDGKDAIFYKGKKFNKDESKIVYTWIVSAGEKEMLFQMGKNRVNENIKKKELLEKQVRFILKIFVGKEMKLPNNHS